jgi:AcrR family transcriptional regulator
MSNVGGGTEAGGKVRVLKAPAVRRAELIDCAQRLFLTRGYERTTINDVIAAAGLSKGAFYHHFRSKEDMLEAIADRFAHESLSFIRALQADPAPNALQRLNRLLSLGRDWKREHMVELRAMFTVLLYPENAVLYHRIVDSVSSVLAPALTGIIAQGSADGVFDVGDPHLAAEILLGLSNGRRALVIAALTTAETDVDAGLAMIVERVSAEEQVTNRILGLTADGVDLMGPRDALRAMLVDWNAAGRIDQAAARSTP